MLKIILSHGKGHVYSRMMGPWAGTGPMREHPHRRAMKRTITVDLWLRWHAMWWLWLTPTQTDDADDDPPSGFMHFCSGSKTLSVSGNILFPCAALCPIPENVGVELGNDMDRDSGGFSIVIGLFSHPLIDHIEFPFTHSSTCCFHSAFSNLPCPGKQSRRISPISDSILQKQGLLDKRESLCLLHSVHIRGYQKPSQSMY